MHAVLIANVSHETTVPQGSAVAPRGKAERGGGSPKSLLVF